MTTHSKTTTAKNPHLEAAQESARYMKHPHCNRGRTASRIARLVARGMRLAQVNREEETRRRKARIAAGRQRGVCRE